VDVGLAQLEEQAYELLGARLMMGMSAKVDINSQHVTQANSKYARLRKGPTDDLMDTTLSLLNMRVHAIILIGTWVLKKGINFERTFPHLLWFCVLHNNISDNLMC
jgi:hypothetical protein